MFYFSAKCSRGDILLSNKYMESTLDTFLADSAVYNFTMTPLYCRMCSGKYEEMQCRHPKTMTIDKI